MSDIKWRMKLEKYFASVPNFDIVSISDNFNRTKGRILEKFLIKNVPINLEKSLKKVTKYEKIEFV